MEGELLKFGGSLAAISLLVLIAWWLGLGGRARIADEAEARALADDAVCGFEAVEIALDADGRGALLCDAQGRIMLLAPHGVKFAARLLDSGVTVERDGNRLVIAAAGQGFPKVSLELGEAAGAWDKRLAALSS